MDKELFEAMTEKEWLSRDELDSMRKKRLGEGLDEMGEEWLPLLRFSYQMEQFDILHHVGELGATTTIVILGFNEDDIDEPDLEDDELLRSMMCQDGEIGTITRYVELDPTLRVEGLGRSQHQDGVIVMHVWT